jgi:hypothetical protein
MSATKNIGASVRARLLNRARAEKVDFNLMLTRYALERLLYRLSVLEWSDELPPGFFKQKRSRPCGAYPQSGSRFILASIIDPSPCRLGLDG